ncbi:CAAX geranylgeranyltransferase alpha subunit [Rhodotorula kratochvilovae]
MSTQKTYVKWADKEGYEDLLPIPQDDAPNCLVPIAYDEMYRDCMDTFRALVAKGEQSERTLEVTQWIIRLNPGHYSVWKYRADTLLALKSDMTAELDFLDQAVQYHLKSYQVWQHRRTIILALNDPSRELDFTAKALAIDAKNYHTWAYRQWVLCHFWSARSLAPEARNAESDDRRKEVQGVWDGELAYVDKLLEEDIRNNSAWNHRFFVAFESGMGGDAGEREIRYAKEKLAISPNNPSAWNYLRGILTRLSLPLSSVAPFATPLALNTPSSMPASEPSVSDKAELPAFLAIEFLADAAVEEAREASRAREEREKKAKEAAELFRSLIEYDPIRREYWRFSAQQAELAVGA